MAILGTICLPVCELATNSITKLSERTSKQLTF